MMKVLVALPFMINPGRGMMALWLDFNFMNTKPKSLITLTLTIIILIVAGFSIVSAAEVTIDDTIRQGLYDFNPSPSVVFTSATVGYVFYIDAGSNDYGYATTTDGGATWSNAISMGDSPIVNWENGAVWYDQWTPGDTSGTKIHIAAVNSTDDDIYYNYLDTSDLSTGSWVSAIDGTVYTAAGDGGPSIAKATDNAIFISGFGTIGGSTSGAVASSTDSGATWGDTGFTATSGLDDDDNGQLLPLSGGDVLFIMHDATQNKIISKEYDTADDTWKNELTIDASFSSSSSYDTLWGATLNKSTGDIYMTGNNDVADDAADLEAYKFTESSRTWSTLTEVVTNNPRLVGGTMAINQTTGDLFAMYQTGEISATSITSANIFYKKSTDGGVTWSGQSVKLNSFDVIGDDYRYVRSNFMNADLLYVVWYDADDHDLFGNQVPFSITEGPEPIIIDTSILDATTEYDPGPALVFTSDLVGYVFYADSTSDLVYRKTADGGKTWGSPVILEPDKVWHAVAVWYDQWTPGDTSGTLIHIAAAESATDDIWYHYLDTADDSLRSGGWVSTIDTTAIVRGTESNPGITKATDDALFVFGSGTIGGVADAFAVASSTDSGATWGDTGFTATGGLDDQDQGQLLPLAGGDVLLIFNDITANTLLSKEYDTTDDTWKNELTIDASWPDSTAYDVTWSASMYKSTGNVYLVGNNAVGAAGADIKSYKFTESSRTWATLTDVYTDAGATITMGSIAIDSNTGNLYGIYASSTPGTNIPNQMTWQYRISTDDGVTWGGSNYLSTTENDFRYIRTNFMSDERLYVAWYSEDVNDIVGSLMADLTPPAAGPDSGSGSGKTGRIGQAVAFDGSNDYISVGNIGTVKTISFWMKADDNTSRKVINIDGTDQIEINSSSAVVATDFPAATVYVDGSSGSATVGTSWHHVIIVDTTGVSASSFEIGRVSSSYFDGMIDDIRVYNRTVTASEIESLYRHRPTSVSQSQNSANISGLVGLWSFNGQDMDWASTTAEALDRSGNGNNGDVTNFGQGSVRPGKVGQALDFDGTDDYVKVPDDDSLDFGAAGAFTLSLWVNVDTSANFENIIDKSTGDITDVFSSAQGWGVQYRTGFGDDGHHFFLRDGTASGSANVTYTSFGDLTGAGWKFITAVVYSDNIITYVDGVVATNKGARTENGSADTTEEFFVGIWEANSSEYDGKADEVRIYNRALSAAEVLELYQGR
jgi:hypothetical protein